MAARNRNRKQMTFGAQASFSSNRQAGNTVNSDRQYGNTMSSDWQDGNTMSSDWQDGNTMSSDWQDGNTMSSDWQDGNTMSSDWQDGNTVLQSLSALYLQDTLSDVKFKFPDQGCKPDLAAHKLILAMRSTVFEKMFYGGLAEKDTVEIKDIPYDIFKSFLQFVYTDQIEFDGETIQLLLYASHKYKLTKLIQECENFLLRCINPEQVCIALQVSSFYDLKKLNQKCMEFIERNAKGVFRSYSWKDLLHVNLMNVLSNDSLQTSEIGIFKAAVDWAEAECRKQGLPRSGTTLRQVLGDAVYQIRIPTLTLQQYSMYVVPSGLLTEQEQLQLYKYFTLQDKTSIDIPPFNCQQRKTINALGQSINQYEMSVRLLSQAESEHPPLHNQINPFQMRRSNFLQ